MLTLDRLTKRIELSDVVLVGRTDLSGFWSATGSLTIIIFLYDEF
jgi:hypothetical protein